VLLLYAVVTVPPAATMQALMAEIMPPVFSG